MALTPNEHQLRNSIAAFYNDYHQHRVRRPDDWMRRWYWPAFRGKTLEFGGGTLLPEHRHNVDYQMIDLSLEAARRAHERGIITYVADGSHAPFAIRSFDTVACYDVLEHIIDPSTFLSEMCRVARQRVVVAGPNYVGLYTGGMSRYLPLRLWSWLTGPGKSCPRIERPHLSFDYEWAPDRDAVAAPNAGWVAEQICQYGFRISHLHTWDCGYQYLDHIPGLRCLGLFMLVIAERI